jgi:hypothetical protein
LEVNKEKKEKFCVVICGTSSEHTEPITLEKATRKDSSPAVVPTQVAHKFQTAIGRSLNNFSPPTVLSIYSFSVFNQSLRSTQSPGNIIS